MPKKRQPFYIWEQTRVRIYKRDKGRCQGPYCLDKPDWSIELEKCHIDHIKSGKLGTNADSNLRVLCRRCHLLRNDSRHEAMRSKSLFKEEGIIPPSYRSLLWDEDDLHKVKSSRGMARQGRAWRGKAGQDWAR